MSEKLKLNVAWISAGVSSFIAAYLCCAEIDKFLYIDVADQHPDSMRFVRDCEPLLGKPIEVLRSNEYANVEQAILAFGGFYNRRTGFAPCTGWLKKRVRKEWEQQHADCAITYYWGMDINETRRAKAIKEGMPEFTHRFPLIENELTKQEAHGICEAIGVKRPLMYNLGYNNNNCVGCVKGGIGYWNKIRVDFPDVFQSRAELERKVGYTILKEADGTPIYLDELDPNRGRMSNEIMQECDLFCIANFV